MEKTPEEVFKRLQEIKEQQKVLAEEQHQLLSEFYDEFQDYEFPIKDDDKDKFFRVYEPEGRFVYNVKYEIGLRAKPLKLYSEKGE